MRTLFFGGSFNPIHYGHIRCASAVAAEGGFGKIILIPSGQPPHKNPQVNLAAATDRLQMCHLAVKGDNLFIVDDIEMRQTGPSYTIQTARELRRRGFDEINWLIGADMLNSLPTWREPEALLREVNFIIMARPGFQLDWEKLGPQYAKLKANVVEIPAIDISATEIRRKVAAAEPIDGLTPPAVLEYIRENRLYQQPTAQA
jgi:nicotinate-nucleotide adenylyltransferase